MKKLPHHGQMTEEEHLRPILLVLREVYDGSLEWEYNPGQRGLIGGSMGDTIVIFEGVYSESRKLPYTRPFIVLGRS